METVRISDPPSWHVTRRELRRHFRGGGNGLVLVLDGTAPLTERGIAAAVEDFSATTGHDVQARFLPERALIGAADAVQVALAEEAPLSAFYEEHVRPLQDDVERLTTWGSMLASHGTALLDSDRWRLGHAVGEVVRRIKRQPPWASPGLVVRTAGEFTAWQQARKERPRSDGSLSVTYVLPELSIAGGVLGVLQLVWELRRLGVDARIATTRVLPESSEWAAWIEPEVYPDTETLSRELNPTDVLVATFWSTADPVAEAVRRGRAKTSAYFLQDYEAWFFPESDPAGRARVIDTYSRIPNRIVKSDWLAGLLADDGYDTKKIHLGMNLGLFYPRPLPKAERPRILAFARPRTPRRGFPSVAQALRALVEQRPEVEIVLFGQALLPDQLDFPARVEGLVTDQGRLAELYSTSHVFLDGSDFQAFGRPALEAMACGTPGVLTGVGGVMEYARHEENCLVVEPKRPEQFTAAILRILDDAALRDRIVENGFETVLQFCKHREARQTRDYFAGLSSTP